jgi:hypothetical protein
MGANQFQTSSRGKTMQQAFNLAVEQAEAEYGHQEGYSGEINCHSSYRDVTSQWKASKLPAQKFIDKAFDDDKLSKHDDPWCICIKEPVKNSNKIKTQVEHVVEKGTKKWVQMYRAHNYTSSKEFLTKGDAVKYAREQCEKTTERYHIDIIKVLEKGSTRTATITYKSSPKEESGIYVFFGEASS